MKETLALDSTQISSWLTCHRQWKLAYLENLVPAVEQEALSTGKLVHRLLELYYRFQKIKNDPTVSGAKALEAVGNWLGTGACTLSPKWDWNNEEADALQATTKDWSEDFKVQKPVPPEDWISLTQRFIQYYTFYYSDSLRVEDVEIGFSVPILETATKFYVLEGRLDLLLRDPTGVLYWADHKSQSRKYEHYPLSPQFLNYCLALGTRRGFINYFGLQKTAPKNGFFKRLPILVSEGLLREWRFDLISIFSEIAAAKERDCFRKNRHSCKNGLNRQCQFTHICEQTIPEFEAEIKRLEFKQREPWTPWRETGE